MSKNFYLDNDDLKLNFANQNWSELFSLMEDKKDPNGLRSVEEAKVLYEEFLISLGQFIAEEIDPKAHLLDTQHPQLIDGEMIDSPIMQEFIKGLRDMGAMALPFSRRLNGFNLPWSVANIVCEMLARADVSLMTYYGFFSGIGLAFHSFALEEGSFTAKNNTITSTRFDDVIKDLAQGKTAAAMCLTEPQAGSDLGQIRSSAKKGPDKYWYLNGQKIWITCGHGEHHLVLARSEDQKTHPGLKGLSLFYVKAHKEENGQKVRNFSLGAQEKKMGQHSSVTVTLNYDNTQAELVGKRGHGFKNMTLLMNSARLLVGYEGLGLCEKAYRMAYDFAHERKSMGKKIADHEIIADYLDEMKVNQIALRALAYKAGFNEEMSNKIKEHMKVASLNEEQKKDYEEKQKYHKWQARLATPLIKYTAAENAVYYARMNMQIMGGVGYMKEYYAEKLMRDSLILPIYEGTSQIQGLMVLKDHLQYAMRNPALFFSKIAQTKLLSLSAKTDIERKVYKLKSLYYSSIQTIMTKILIDKFGDLKGKPIIEWKSAFLQEWDARKDYSFGLLNAEKFCLIASRLWMAKALVKQTLKIEDEKIKKERIKICDNFMNRCEAKMKGWLLEIESSKEFSHLLVHKEFCDNYKEEMSNG